MQRKLYEVTERMKIPVFTEEKVEELYGDILMAVKALKKEGKGYLFLTIGHVIVLERKIRGAETVAVHG